MEKHLQYLHEGWEFKQMGHTDWRPAMVPGCVHTDLMDNGVIEDPFYRDNEIKLQWIGKTDWDYRLKFKPNPEVLSKNHIELVFDGLDTYTEVFLNGQRLLQTDNMFRQWRIACKELLADTTNILVVRFRSPINEILPRMESMSYELPAVNDQGEKTSPHTRKAPYHFGWDWGPRFVTCGIWRQVYLEGWDVAKIEDVKLNQTELNRTTAKLRVDVAIHSDSTLPLILHLRVGTQTATTSITTTPGASSHSVTVKIPDPKLWWPNGLGDQALYPVVVSISAHGQSLDVVEKRIGFRTVELRREQDQWGESFEFIVNGVPVFAKGGNWIPADNFLNRITRDRYRWLLQSCKDANMNMLRIWGGGIYEQEVFYNLCDEMGIMIWQDFMFACSMYPGDEAFLDNVASEAESNIKRLRHHPSIVLWCGNNEVETAWVHWGWENQFPRAVWDAYEKIFHQILPTACATYDPARPYWPSSPSSNRKADPESQEMGDLHYWAVWHAAKPFKEYENQHPRFMSEYGFQAFPGPKTVATYTLPTDHDIESPVMMVHQKHPRGNQLIQEYMLRDYNDPKDFNSFLIVSQILQAEGIKIGAEHLRRIMPRCMGSLYWQIDDCWPVASWSSIDYFGRWKALHYYAKEFYCPVLVSPHVERDTVKITIVSDRRRQTKAQLKIALLDFNGESFFSQKLEVAIAPLTSSVYFAIEKSRLLESADPKRIVLWCTLTANGKEISANRLYFVPPKNMQLPEPTIETELIETNGAIKIRLQTDTLAKNVYLSANAFDGFFTNNFFDLKPDSGITLSFRSNTKIDLKKFKDNLRIITLRDTY